MTNPSPRPLPLRYDPESCLVVDADDAWFAEVLLHEDGHDIALRYNTHDALVEALHEAVVHLGAEGMACGFRDRACDLLDKVKKTK